MKLLKQYFQPVFGAGPSQHSHYLDSKRTHNMREGRESPSIGFSRRLTNGESNPFTLVQWEKRDVTITNWQDDSIVFEQRDVEFPTDWSINASNIVTQKYFWGALDTEQREKSLKDLLNRVVNQIINWGDEGGYFASNDEKGVFADELMSLLLLQKASFNSPVWFNIGVPDIPQQSSACFIPVSYTHLRAHET